MSTDRTLIFHDENTPVAVHTYDADPGVYFLSQRSTNNHVGTLSLVSGPHDDHPIAIRALLAIAMHDLEHNSKNTKAEEVVSLLSRASVLLEAGQADD